jgi:hypothetical protein
MRLNLDGVNEMKAQIMEQNASFEMKAKRTPRKLWFWMIVRFALVLLGVLLLTGCGSQARVGALQTESQSVELGDARSVRVEINLGAGDLQVAGGAEKLLEADFTYNVARLKPEVKYTEGTLVVRQPETEGLPDLRDITDFRNQWGLRLNDEVPIDLSVDMGAGTSDLQLAGLSLTGLDVNLGAGEYKVDMRATGCVTWTSPSIPARLTSPCDSPWTLASALMSSPGRTRSGPPA